MKTIIGETWSLTLTDNEYSAWDIYADSHSWLFNGISYEPILVMFLSHFRHGINLNKIKNINK